MDMAWAVNDNLTVFAAASFNDTELVYVDPAFDIVVADAGSMLPLTPETQFSVRARTVGIEHRHERALAVGYKYAGERSTPSLTRSMSPTPCKIAMAFSMDHRCCELRQWLGVELFGSNLTDERAQLHINRQDFFERVTAIVQERLA